MRSHRRGHRIRPSMLSNNRMNNDIPLLLGAHNVNCYVFPFGVDRSCLHHIELRECQKVKNHMRVLDPGTSPQIRSLHSFNVSVFLHTSLLGPIVFVY